jgi:hypothetical protein
VGELAGGPLESVDWIPPEIFRGAETAEAFVCLSEGIVADAMRCEGGRAGLKGSDVAADRDVCFWIMLHSRSRRELGDTAALLDLVKGLVPESRIDEICDSLIRNMRGRDPLRDAREQQIQYNTRQEALYYRTGRCLDLIEWM